MQFKNPNTRFMKSCHSFCGLVATLAAGMALAQNPATDLARDRNKNLPEPLRENLETIGRYADAVNQRAQGTAPRATPGKPAGTVSTERQLDLLNDPFEVSPQLRAGKKGARFTGLPATTLTEMQRRLQIKALIHNPQGKLAMLLVNNKESITVMDGELVDLGDMGTFRVQVDAASVTLSSPDSPQGKKVILR